MATHAGESEHGCEAGDAQVGDERAYRAAPPLLDDASTAMEDAIVNERDDVVCRQLAILGLVVLFGLALPIGGAAAPPTKGGLYIGKLTTALGTEKRLSLNIAKDGKTAVAVLSCSNVRVGTIKKVAITGSTFKGANRVGSVTVWSIAGSFSSATRAVAKLSLNAICDGRGGTVVLPRTKP